MTKSKLIVFLICFLVTTTQADESSKLKEFMSTKEGKELREMLDSPSFMNSLADIAMFQKLSELVNARYKELTGNGTSHHHAIVWLKNLPIRTAIRSPKETLAVTLPIAICIALFIRNIETQVNRSFVPEVFQVKKVLYRSEESWGFGPGGNVNRH